MKKAFTFAEVLLAIAIVGIISALIIPILMNSTSNKVLETKLKKATSEIMNATKMIMSEERAEDVHYLENIAGNGSNEKTGFYYTAAGAKTSNSKQGVEFFLTNYFKPSKTNCGSGGTKECIGKAYKSPGGKSLGTISSSYYCIKTKSSAAICMARVGDYVNVIVDVNGQDLPNMTGVDTFSMYITNKGDLKDLDSDSSLCNKNKATVDVPSYAAGCYARVIENGWKMPEDYGSAD